MRESHLAASLLYGDPHLRSVTLHPRGDSETHVCVCLAGCPAHPRGLHLFCFSPSGSEALPFPEGKGERCSKVRLVVNKVPHSFRWV
jgi:hypothetical protein